MAVDRGVRVRVLLDDISRQAREAGGPLVGKISTESGHFSDGEWSVPMGVVSNSTPSRIATICPPGSLLFSGLRHPLRGYGRSGPEPDPALGASFRASALDALQPLAVDPLAILIGQQLTFKGHDRTAGESRPLVALQHPGRAEVTRLPQCRHT